MLVSLQIQGAPQELASVLAAIGGISLPLDLPASSVPLALPAETKTRKTAQKEAPKEPVKEEESKVLGTVEADAAAQQEEPKTERLTLEKIRAVFNDKLAAHRDKIKEILASYDSKGLTDFHGKTTPEQHLEFFNAISAL